MKKIILTLILFLSLFALTACGNKEEVKKELTDAEKFKNEYESMNGKEVYGKKTRELTIPEDNPFIYATAGDILEKIDNKETFLVYFGFNSCPWCRSVVEELIKVAEQNNIKKIYYVDVKEIRDTKEIDEDGKFKTTKEGTKDYYKLLDELKLVLEDYTLEDEEGEEISAEEKRIYAPNVVAIVNGKAEDMKDGTPESLTDPFQELTKEIKKEIAEEFECLVKCMNEKQNKCTKAC